MYDDAFVVGGAVAGRHRCNRAVAQRAPADGRTTDDAAAAAAAATAWISFFTLNRGNKLCSVDCWMICLVVLTQYYLLSACDELRARIAHFV